jgi:Protein kinase domain
VADAVADGHQVDWPEVHRRLGGTDVAQAATALQEIDSHGRESRSTSLATQPRRKLQRFLYLMIPAVGLQVSAGVVAYFFGPVVLTSMPGWPQLVSAVVFLAAGVTVALAGRWDPRTAPLAGLFLSIASAPGISLTIFMGSGLGRQVASAPLFETFFPFFFWWFVEGFPRVVRLERRGRWIGWLKRASLWVGAAFFLVNLVDRLLPVEFVPRELAFFVLRSTNGGYWLTLFALALPAPLVIFARLRHAEGEERRRAKLFMIGLAVGILPIIVVVLAEILIPGLSASLSSPRMRLIESMVLYGFMLTIPVTLGYAAVARHALDFRFALSRATRAVLARSTLWTLSVVPWLILVGVLWMGREHRLSELFQKPIILFLVGIGILGIALILTRDRLLAGFERRLSGSRVAPGAAIAGFSQRLSTVRDHQELAAVVNNGGTGLLQAEACFLLVWSEGERGYVSLQGECGHVRSDSALAQLAAVSSTPISLEERAPDSWLQWLPEPDRLWAAEADVRLVLPVSDRDGDCAALIAFGPSESGLPFSVSQRDVAAAMSSSVALTVARLGSVGATGFPVSAAASDEPADECGACGRVSPVSSVECTCGGGLGPAAIPLFLNGKFRLEKVLGRGGMGVVYLGRDVGLDRLVALKTLPRMRSGSLLRFRREARSMASFVHPNLALIFGLETWRGIPVLVVEYLSGGTLAQRIGNGNAPEIAVELGIKLAGALSALHSKGLLHRDVKPANIGFSESDEPKLLDFGLTQFIEDTQDVLSGTLGPSISLEIERKGSVRLTETSHVVGTPMYLCPEILTGGEPSAGQDLWALHMVLWEVLAGRHPLDGLPGDAGLDLVRGGEVPSIRAACPQCPEPLAVILDRGLSRRSASRRTTADQVQRDLRGVLPRLKAS